MPTWRERIIGWHERVALREEPGAGNAAARAGLGAAAAVFGAATGLRDVLYRTGLLPVARAEVPVISVGNLTLGGTGKTPLVEWLAARCLRAGRRTAVLSRGYGAVDDEVLDDDPELAAVVRLTGPSRARLAAEAVRDYGARVLILDDGFQHRRLHRDLDIVCVDALRPFGNGRRIPRGILREPPSALRRAGVVVLTRVDQSGPEALNALRATLRGRLADGVPVVETVHRPVALLPPAGEAARDPSWLRGREVFAFCGIGNPAGFRRTLESLGAGIVRFRTFPDHHPYTPADMDRLRAESREYLAEAMVTTEKDRRRIGAAADDPLLFALRVRLEPVRHGEELAKRVDALLEPAPAPAARPEGVPR